MQQAVPVGEGAMAALMGLDLETVQDLARQAANGEICQVANDNAPGQVVISGSKTAIDRAVELARERGARRSVLLPVSAPFHCELMQPAAETSSFRILKSSIVLPSRSFTGMTSWSAEAGR